MKRCRACGHKYNDYDMIGATCLYCGSTKLTSSPISMGKGAKFSIGFVIFLFVVITSVWFFVPREYLENASESVPKEVTEATKQIQNIVEKPVEVTEQQTNEVELRAASEIHRLVNLERGKSGLAQLAYDVNLANIAKSHSADMAVRNFFAHENPDGKDPTARGLAVGYNCRYEVGNLIYEGLGENLHMESGSTLTFLKSHESIANSAVSNWMSSPGHKENILTPTYRIEGIGVEVSPFEIHVTQMFC